MTALLVLLCGLLTIMLETPLICIGFGKLVENKRKLVMNSVLINVITNISLSAFILHGIKYYEVTGVMLFIAEVCIVFLEAVMYRYAAKEIPWKNAFATSLLVNAFSAIAGTFLWIFIMGLLLTGFNNTGGGLQNPL